MNEKPIYKRWWLLIIVAAIAIGVFGSGNESKNDAKEVKTEANDDTEVKTEKSEEQVIEVGEEVPFVDFTAKIQRIKIKDDALTVVLDWTNQSEYDQAHFTLLAGIDVSQKDILEMTKGEERLLKKIKKDRFDVVDLEYNLEDNETPITIKFIPWNEYDEKKEIKININ